VYEVHGLRVGHRELDSSYFFLNTDPGKLIGVSFYMWCIRNKDNLVLVDTGLSDAELNRTPPCKNAASPATQLGKIGITPEEVKTIIITHLHGDHFSAFKLYPNATFYIQRKEIEFFATVDVRNAALVFAVGNIDEVVRLNYAGRVRVLDGDEEIVPGISVVLVGGHTVGSQVVVVQTSEGKAVLCGDAADFFRSIEDNIPSGRLADPIQAYLALAKIRKLPSRPDLAIPSHDPLLIERFPKIAEGVIKIGKR